MNEFNNSELMIISKYLNFKDFNNFMKLNDEINKDIRQFELDVYNYVFTNNEIKKIEKYLLNFPKLEELILCFGFESTVIYYWNFIDVIMNNLIRFSKLKYSLKIKFIDYKINCILTANCDIIMLSTINEIAKYDLWDGIPF